MSMICDFSDSESLTEFRYLLGHPPTPRRVSNLSRSRHESKLSDAGRSFLRHTYRLCRKFMRAVFKATACLLCINVDVVEYG
ncbi:unnamed protein product [Bursaphelenchus okinawaensis]|uniref:Uncharacterized protein n=1 Tax=Bursaphelenchus okinawaensis TaxID=465554 RepID=A0A811JR66_9BILA|nr:unnamed protein product [Bursaphelenchus okinawaensis]CAG9079297.1 unnamed protein product [Bursaphelenchus okinawaensis]